MADHNDKKLPNLEVIRNLRIRGQHVAKGTIFPKSEFPGREGDWLDLCFGDNAKLKQTDEEPREAPTADAPADETPTDETPTDEKTDDAKGSKGKPKAGGMPAVTG